MSSTDIETPGGPLTAAQAGCLIAYTAICALWILSEVICAKQKGGSHEHEGKSEELVPIIIDGSPNMQRTSSDDVKPTATSGWLSPTFIRLLGLDRRALVSSRAALRAGVELGTILLWFYVADRTNTIAAGPKSYNRDLFLFIFVVLTIVAASYTMKKARAPVLINRQQTEEWKGWMQVLFLLYHYYEAREAYNAIRIFIASYVWMTGFGNFSYYYKTRDFSLGRFAQMLWRLNMLVTLCCAALDNSYMLYYICPMHTLFTVMVYAALGLWRKGLDSYTGVWLKIAACVACVVVVWEFKFVFYILSQPFTFLMKYVDPRRPIEDEMHEWFFRSGLDRYIWIHGMICGFLHPSFDAWLKSLEDMAAQKRIIIKGMLLSVSVAVGYAWYTHVYVLPKFEYNALHPFTSWIPITAFLMIRNLSPDLRLNSLGLYGWLGCITLETYIAQYHTWLLSKIPDGQPIYLLSLLPGYPLLNFALVTALYVFISHRLFQLTSTLRDALVPHDDDATLLRNVVTMCLSCGVLFAAGFVVQGMHHAL